MNNTLSQLAAAAKAQPNQLRKAKGKWTKYAEVVEILQEKNWSYRKILDWLIEQGEPLTLEDLPRFTASASRTKRFRQKGKEGKAE